MSQFKDGDVSESQVLQSAAGFYIGTTYYDEFMKGWFPNSRDSMYFNTRAEAERFLVWWK